MPWGEIMRLARRWKGPFSPRANLECAFSWLASKIASGRSLPGHSTRNLPIEVVNATEAITMSDSPSQAFRRKKDSSVHVAAKLVKDGAAEALVSAGNTGAVMTVARFVLGTLGRRGPSGARRRVSKRQGKAHGDSRCRRQRGFQAGADRAVRRHGRDLLPLHLRHQAPAVALLSIGEEEMKGNELTREAAARLKSCP